MGKRNIFTIYAERLKFANLTSYAWIESLPEDPNCRDKYRKTIEKRRDISQERYTDPNSIVIMRERNLNFLVWRNKNRYYAFFVDNWDCNHYCQFYKLRSMGVSVRDALTFIEL